LARKALEKHRQEDKRISDPADSIPIVRINKFHVVAIIRVKTRVKVCHVSGNEDSRHPCQHREHGRRVQYSEINRRQEKKKREKDDKLGEEEKGFQ